MKIDTNFNSVKLGEQICYHIGFLAIDRDAKEHGEFTDKARELQQVANAASGKSTAFCDKLGKQGTGEFELKQYRISNMSYMYLAKRIKRAVNARATT